MSQNTGTPDPDEIVAPDPLAAAVENIRAYCGWHIAPVRTETLVLDGPGGRLIMLPSLKVVEILELANDGHVMDPAKDYDWSVRGMIDLRGRRASRRLGGIEITLTHGFETFPASLAAIATSLAARGMAEQPTQRTAGPFNVSYSAQVAGGVAGGFSEAQRGLLDTYRLPARP